MQTGYFRVRRHIHDHTPQGFRYTIWPVSKFE